MSAFPWTLPVVSRIGFVRPSSNRVGDGSRMPEERLHKRTNWTRAAIMGIRWFAAPIIAQFQPEMLS